MRRILALLLTAMLAVVVIVAAIWASLALWYRLPLGEIGRAAAACVFMIIGLGSAIALFSRRRLGFVLAFAAALIALLVWWSTIRPPATAEWAPDVARQVTGVVDDDILTLSDVRSFDWRTETDFTEHWEQRSYDISKLKTLDLFMSYWSGPAIAHVILSFGFEDGAQLAWSIEVRRRQGGAFSPLADLFKSNPLVIIAADERDVVGVRSNVRGEDVQLYRLKASPAAARALLMQYVSDANALAAQPKFYNSLTTNCTTAIVTMIRAVGDRLPFDWRLIINGYLPEYAYDQGALAPVPMPELRALSHIGDKARLHGLSPDFPRAIRVGVPSPR